MELFYWVYFLTAVDIAMWSLSNHCEFVLLTPCKRRVIFLVGSASTLAWFGWWQACLPHSLPRGAIKCRALDIKISAHANLSALHTAALTKTMPSDYPFLKTQRRKFTWPKAQWLLNDSHKVDKGNAAAFLPLHHVDGRPALELSTGAKLMTLKVFEPWRSSGTLFL